ncbi:MAG: lysophospholipid acyltransferase family protein [Pseudomonadota bacterium]
MMLLRLRQIVFNMAFYSTIIFFCFALLPAMLLPRTAYIRCLNLFFKSVYLCEKYILGLDYEVRGLENIPKEKAFLIAAKHCSAYETFKLNLLFQDTAIINKKELQYIPLWGWIAKRAGMIFIERGTSKGLQSLINGAKRVKAEGRPLVIFPQGTRVPVDSTAEKYPYKRGVVRVYEATEQSILPIATNSGLFWPKGAFYIKPGKVIFECLPVIPSGLAGDDVLIRLQDSIETASHRLVAEGRIQLNKQTR